MHRSRGPVGAWPLAGIALALLSMGAAPLAAQPESARSSGEGRGCAARVGALGRVACELGEQLLPRARGASVELVSLESDVPLPDAAALELRIRELVGGIISSAPPAFRSAERLELRISIARGMLGVTADLKKRIGVWQRAKPHASAVLLHGYAEHLLDAELRRWVPAPALVVSEVTRVPLPERPVVALACGDIGPDGAQEILLVSRSSVAIGRIVGGRFSTSRRTLWTELSAVAPAPLREPIATASIERDGTIRVGSSDRADALELSAELRVQRRLGPVLPASGGGCSDRLELGFAGTFGPCTPGEAQSALDLGGTLDAVASAARPFAPSQVVAGRGAQGTLRLAGIGARVFDSQAAVGAQIALGDADRDGALEVASSLDTADAARDRVQVSTLRGGKLEPRFELATAGAIRALSFCTRPEGTGMAPLVIATEGELWVVR